MVCEADQTLIVEDLYWRTCKYYIEACKQDLILIVWSTQKSRLLWEYLIEGPSGVQEAEKAPLRKWYLSWHMEWCLELAYFLLYVQWAKKIHETKDIFFFPKN